MSIRRPDGEPVGIELIGNDSVRKFLDKVNPPRRTAWSDETGLKAIGMVADPQTRTAGLRLAMAVGDMSARPARRFN